MDRVEEFLAGRGALGLDHPGGTLLAHLRRTRDTLAGWGARRELCLAGLAHAAYGTDGFPRGLLELDERDLLAGLIGAEAEAIVYLYCGCDRTATYPMWSVGEPRLRDRFTGALLDPRPEQIRDLVELTFANELDVLAHSDELRARYTPGLQRLCLACRPYASVAANAAVAEFFG